MNKALLFGILLSSNISFAAYTPLVKYDNNAEVARNPSCTVQQFRQEIVDFSTLKGYSIKTLADNEAVLFETNKSSTINTFRSSIYFYTINYPSYTTNIKSLNDRLTAAVNSYKNYFKTFLYCADAKILVLDEEKSTFSMSPENSNISDNLQNYLSFEQAYPSVGTKPNIVVFDTILDAGWIYNPHKPRIVGGKSFVPFTSTPIIPATAGSTMPHGSSMAFTSLMASDAIVTPMALALVTDIDSKLILDAAKYTVSIKSTLSTPVANWSFSKARTGNDEKISAAAKVLHDAGIPVVQAIGNYGEEKSRFVAYDPNIITVGYTTQGLLKGFSSYGNDGPDLLVEQSGDAVDVNNNGSYKFVQFTTYKSSGATALVSGIVSRMRNTCPKSTPDEIKSALIDTAIKYTGAQASFVKGGYVNPTAALNKLKNMESCTDPNIPPIGNYCVASANTWKSNETTTTIWEKACLSRGAEPIQVSSTDKSCFYMPSSQPAFAQIFVNTSTKKAYTNSGSSPTPPNGSTYDSTGCSDTLLNQIILP